jgi:hypothetical protein
MNCALAVLGAWKMIGSCTWSIDPLFQLILGCVTVNHGYPKMALFSLKFKRKKLRLVYCVPICT